MSQPRTVARATDQRRHQDAHAPTVSYWVGVARDQWAAVLAAEATRMRLTRFGGYSEVMLAPTVESRRRDARPGEP